MNRNPPRVVRLGLMWMIGAPLITFFLVGGLLFWHFMPAIGIGQIWVAVSLLLLGVYGVISWRVGKSRARQARLMAEGLRGTAVVLQAEGTGVLINQRPQLLLRLRVELPGRALYEVEHREIAPYLGLEALGAQRRVAVIVDRDDPQRLMIDWGAASIARPAGDVLTTRLEKLKNLHQRGLISDADFDEQRKRVLAEL